MRCKGVRCKGVRSKGVHLKSVRSQGVRSKACAPKAFALLRNDIIFVFFEFQESQKSLPKQMGFQMSIITLLRQAWKS